MEIDSLRRFDGNIISALKLVPETQWSLLFRNLRDFYQNQISGCPNDKLVELKAKIIGLQEIEQLFKINRDLAPE
jgi:hypothetical protein